MQDITVLGLDIAKNVFQLIGVNKHHQVVFKKRCSRAKLIETLTHQPSCTILMESCGSSNYWGRKFIELGHNPKLISPQHVNPYVGNHKNDYKDTEAIIEAGTRPRTQFVAIKTIEQQDIQSIIRVRDRLVSNRVSLSNQLRGLLQEYGLSIKQGFGALKAACVDLLDSDKSLLTDFIKDTLRDVYAEFVELSSRITSYDKKIAQVTETNACCRLLKTIPGIGPIASASLYAAIGNGSQFKNGRELAATIGLVPRQHSSGEKQRLFGISRLGNAKLKELLIHGARSVVRNASKKTDKRSGWVISLANKKHANVAATAVANRTARIAWAVLNTQTAYTASGYATQTAVGAC